MFENPIRLGEQIVDRCRELGFALAGVTPAEPTRRRCELDQWLDSDQHGSMSWLARHVEQRADPARFFEGARSIILVADQYASRNEEPDQADESAPPRGRIARYARGDDYHTVMKKRLHRLADDLQERFPDGAFRTFVDTAPVLEREHASRAGLGWIGKHTLLIHHRRGSYLLLGGIVTTLEIEPPRDQRQSPDHCGSCTRCIDACPTDAITPYKVDATKCLSYLNIEHRGPIDEEFFEPMGDWLFGCDICQEVCPHNSPRDVIPTGSAHAAYAPRRDSFDLLEVLGWTEEDRRAAFTRSSMKRATLAMMKRNALIVVGNELAKHDDADLRARIESIVADDSEDELMRVTAAAVLDRLRSQ